MYDSLARYGELSEGHRIKGRNEIDGVDYIYSVAHQEAGGFSSVWFSCLTTDETNALERIDCI